MSAVTTDHLIRPHGGVLVERTGARPDDLDSLEAITLTSRELSDLDMLASGALSPLAGFLGRENYESVVESMRLASGLPWALPVCLAVAEPPTGDRVALADESGRPLAVLEVEEVYAYDKEREAERCNCGAVRHRSRKPWWLKGLDRKLFLTNLLLFLLLGAVLWGGFCFERRIGGLLRAHEQRTR